jgi:small conductance mechanosensitive channel
MTNTIKFVSLANLSMADIQNKLDAFITAYGWKVVGAVIILVTGFVLSRWIGKIAERALNRHQMEPPVRLLLVQVVRLSALVFTIMAVVEQMGFPVTTLLAGLSVVGIGVGLAMQGVLGNVISGLMIIFTRPFKVGEYIELAGVHGMVKTIDILTTQLTHADLSIVIVPNSKIVNEILHNYGGIRQVNLSVGLAYGTDLNKVSAIVKEVLDKNRRVLKTPAGGSGVASLSDSAIVIGVAFWTTLDDFNDAGGEVYAELLKQFSGKGVEIAPTRREITILDQTKAA